MTGREAATAAAGGSGSGVVEVKKEGRVFIVTLKNGENRFSSAFVRELNKALDEVEQGARQDGAEGALPW